MSAAASAGPDLRPLRLGFLGVGWIGLHRMRAILDTGLVSQCAVADASEAACRGAVDACPDAAVAADLDDLLERDLDGLVIATPSALHAEQAIRAFDRKVAVFCQKPLARNAAEARAVVEAARRADRLLGVDFSYRHTEGMQRIYELMRAGQLGDAYAADLVFHNAYGPDKPWFHDRRLSGGGCLIDLGVHLIDLAMWALDYPVLAGVSGFLCRHGRPPLGDEVEDFASAQILLADGGLIRIACSWNLPAGRDAIIGAHFYGTRGAAAFENVDGSFYDFIAQRMTGTSAETIASPRDDWGGRAATAWAIRLAAGSRFDADADHLVAVSEVIDAIYADAGRRSMDAGAPS